MFIVLLSVVLLVRCAPAAFPRRQECCRLRHSAHLDSSTPFANFFFSLYLAGWVIGAHLVSRCLSFDGQLRSLRGTMESPACAEGVLPIAKRGMSGINRGHILLE